MFDQQNPIGNVTGETVRKGSTTPLDSASIPGFLPKGKKGKDAADMLENFRARCQVFDLTDPSSIFELEQIKTRAIQNKGVYVMSENGFVFMDKYMIVLQYLEEDKE